jgi:hypothetical protein
MPEDGRTDVSAGGMRYRERHHQRALGVLGGVRSTEPVVGHFDHDFIRPALWLGTVLEPQIMRCVENGCSHIEDSQLSQRCV